MGKSLQGINGAFTGKVGTVVGYVLNGQNIMRALPRQRTSKTSPAEKTSRGKMKVLSELIQPLANFMHMAFSPLARGTVSNWYNLAISYNNPKAIKGEFPELEIDYPNVVLSRGVLQKPENVVLERIGNEIKISWDTTAADQQNHDQVMLLAYLPNDKTAKSKLGGKIRKEGSDVLTLTEKQIKEEIHVYISFVTNDRQQFSDSLYVGKLEQLYKPKKKAVAKVKNPKVAEPEVIYVKQPENKIIEQVIATTDVTEAKLDVPDAAQLKAIEIARNFKALGFPVMSIAQATGLSSDVILGL